MTLFPRELNLFWIALMFLTRLPAPTTVEFSQHNLNRASRYFPLVGFLIGLLSAAMYSISSWLLPPEAALIITMIFGLLLTGCFHEDGLADTCDGFGGGWDQQQKLKIMKDSRIGTYGSVALWSSLSLKFVLLGQLENISIALIVGHTFSRAVSTSFIYWLPYVSDSDTAKTKPLAETTVSIDRYVIWITGLAALLLVVDQFFTILLVSFVVTFIMRQLLLKQIQGFTGDTLGAIQQVMELTIYMVLASQMVEL